MKATLAKGEEARCSSTSGWKRSYSANAVWYTPRCTCRQGTKAFSVHPQKCQEADSTS